MESSYELFDHTADMGVRVRAATREGLVVAAIGGFYATIGALVAGGEESAFSFQRRGDDDATLLRDFLNELLILFERDKQRTVHIREVLFLPGELAVSATVAAIDEKRSEYHREVKAITYHELAIRSVEGEFEATFIVDI
jgi:SHS2 domain-containing protein